MKLPVQTLIPGLLQKAYDREFSNLVAAEAVSRLWARDPSLWPVDDSQDQDVTANLGWLDLPGQIGAHMARAVKFAAAVEAEGFEYVVFVAMGDSNLAAEAILNLSLEKRGKRIFVLDSTDPATVGSVEKELNLPRTLFIFASKSGKHIETHALLLYFLHLVRARGINSPGAQFVAVTEENSYLADLAEQYQFRGTFFDPPGIKGRYSALIHFGLFLSALCRLDPASLLSRITAMRDLCLPSTPAGANPALALAAFLAAGAVEGADKFLLLSTKSLTALTYRIGQLVGVSTSKGGRGLIPIPDGAASGAAVCKSGCIAAIWTMLGDDDSAVKETAKQLQEAGVPVVFVELSAPEELGATLFKWEIATALACSLLHVNPFSEPDAEEGREKTAELLETLVATRELPWRTVRVREVGIELYAEGATRQEISTLSLSDALRTFFAQKNPDGYVALLVFVDQSPAVEAVLRRLREQLASRLGIAVLLSFGPRYLHSLGQVYKGGPSKGLFLILTSEPAEDIDIPGAGYSFGQLQLALALGDFESLQSRKKLVVHLHLTEGTERGLAQLEQVLQHALRNARA